MAGLDQASQPCTTTVPRRSGLGSPPGQSRCPGPWSRRVQPCPAVVPRRDESPCTGYCGPEPGPAFGTRAVAASGTAGQPPARETAAGRTARAGPGRPAGRQLFGYSSCGQGRPSDRSKGVWHRGPTLGGRKSRFRSPAAMCLDALCLLRDNPPIRTWFQHAVNNPWTPQCTVQPQGQ